MDDKKQTETFSLELTKLIDKFAREFDLSYASVIGVMVIKVVSMIVRTNKEK